MKIFVSWSGALSKEVAQILRTWLPRLIQSLEVFYSPEDIEKGDNWDTKISSELSLCNYGIVCLTAENTAAPWIHFEAGALAKTFDARVTALMININPSDIKGPLSRYQATRLEKSDFFQLVESINKALETPLDNTVLEPLFDVLWKQIKDEVEAAILTHSKTGKGVVSKDPVNAPIEEILQLLRKQNTLLSNPEELLPQAYFEHLQKNVISIGNRKDMFLPYMIRYLESVVENLERYNGDIDLNTIEFFRFQEIFMILEENYMRSGSARTSEKNYMKLRDLREHYEYIVRNLRLEAP